MTVGESICQQKRENNKSIYKISKFRNCWLTVLTNGFNKSKLWTVRIVHKNIVKIIQFRTYKISAIAELRKFQKSSKLRKFLNYLDLEKFCITELREFSTQAKRFRELQDKSGLEKFSDVVELGMIMSCIKILIIC